MTHYPTLPLAVYAKRRKQLARSMLAQGGGVALLYAGPEIMRNRDADYPFRTDSYFYYLTGFPEPEACLALVADAASRKVRSVLFCREKDPEREIWEGFRFGPEAACQAFGMDEAQPETELETRLETLLANQHQVYVLLGQSHSMEEQALSVLATLRGKARHGINAPQGLADASHLLDDMRLFKGREEIRLMKRAASISAQAHQAAMQATRPGCFEYEIEAELLYHFRKNGSEFPAYGSIVASGANACVLHYRANNARLQAGDLLLIDAGCELDCYASDITRTFPVSGCFSAPQQAVYEVVLAAQHAAIKATRPGKRFNQVHDAAVKVLVQGLIDLKILKGSVSGNLESGKYRNFYMHRTSHWLGMDVHDCGSYRNPHAKPGETGPKTSRTLEPGMVLTIEPGLYIGPAKEVPAKYHNIGIRIEDDALVTAHGCEVYTEAAPKQVDDIHHLMKAP
ncbi:MAG: Xaa-Pro aminopeptidase [Limnobacter sp.]|nr:Xaa-Pro aminopeptidase [Limnobacter sp.]